MSKHLIDLQHISKSYDGQMVLDDLNLYIRENEFLTLLGPSGCGKSTLLYLISGLQSPTSGRIFFGDRDVTLLPPEKRGIGLVFQNYALYPHMTVEQNIAFPLVNQKVKKEEIRERTEEMAKLVQIGDLLKRKPSQLSGGQQQRVSIARALAGNPSVILADEPTGALDSRTGREVLSFLQKLNREGDTVVLITHDNSIAVRAKRIVRLQDGRIIYDGDAHDPKAVVQPEELTGDDGAGFDGANAGEGAAV